MTTLPPTLESLPYDCLECIAAHAPLLVHVLRLPHSVRRQLLRIQRRQPLRPEDLLLGECDILCTETGASPYCLRFPSVHRRVPFHLGDAAADLFLTVTKIMGSTIFFHVEDEALFESLKEADATVFSQTRRGLRVQSPGLYSQLMSPRHRNLFMRNCYAAFTYAACGQRRALKATLSSNVHVDQIPCRVTAKATFYGVHVEYNMIKPILYVTELQPDAPLRRRPGSRGLRGAPIVPRGRAGV